MKQTLRIANQQQLIIRSCRRLSIRGIATFASSKNSFSNKFEDGKKKSNLLNITTQNNNKRCLSSAAADKKDEEFVMLTPSMGDSISEGTLQNWLKNVGDYVADDEAFAVVETDKVVVDITATPRGGTIIEAYAKKGDTIKVSSPLVKFKAGPPPAGSATKPKPPAPAATSPAAAAPAPQVAAPPTAKSSPPSPAPAAAVAAPTTTAPVAAAKPPKPTPSPAAPVAPVIPGSRTERRVKMTRMRQRIAERLLEAQSTAAMLTTFNEIDMSKLTDMRNTYKDMFHEKHGAKLGFMSAFVYASTVALKEIPSVNASIVGDEIVYHDYVDMSIAVSAPGGLVVPVIRNTETMNFAQIEQAVATLGDKAKKSALTLEEMTGGTFTITNGGVFGSLMSTPMLNPPQSAILGMHGIKKRPVVDEKTGQVVIRPVMIVALSYDHRLIDGRESVTFLKSVKDKLEDPVRLLLGL